MRQKILLLSLFPLLAGISSCSVKQKSTGGQKSVVYLDSMNFRYFQKDNRPYLLSSTTYAYNDSMSQILDGADFKLLEAMNEIPSSEPLSYEQLSDTIVVGMIYSRGNSMFAFGELHAVEDSIFISFSGASHKDIPKIAERFTVPYRFYRSEFKIRVDTNKTHLIFYRR